MRRIPVLIAAAAAFLVTGALTGCSNIALPDLSGACKPPIQSGPASDLVSVTGDPGAQPEVDFPTPLIPDGSERTLLIEGHGDELPVGGIADIEIGVYDATTGAEQFVSDYDEDGSAQRLIAGDLRGALSEAVVCAREGSRIALATTLSEVSADELPEGQEDTGFVVVIDVERTWLGKANGINQLPVDGMPTVATAVDGQPGILVPKETAPTASRISVVKAGGGAVVADGDTAVLHIRSWGWPHTPGDRPVMDTDTWTAAPLSLEISDDMEQGATFASAVRGAKVGSQLLIVVEAEEAGGVATIYVVDVLGIES